MRFRTAILWSGISLLGNSGITLISTIILARMLSPDDFGIIGIVTIFISLSQMMVDSEMGGALLRKKEVNNTDYSTLFYYNLVVSLVLYGILFFTAPLIAEFYDKPQLTEIIRILSITIIIHAFRVVQRIIIYRNLKFKINAYINVGAGIVSLGLAVWLAHKGLGYWALVWQQICLALCTVLFMTAYTGFIPVRSFSKKSFKYQFNFGISLLGSDIIRTVAGNISTNIIAKIASLQFVGYYTQASRLTNFCQTTFGSLMDQCIFPMLAKYEDRNRVRTMYHSILRIISLLLSVLTIILIVFSTPIVEIILGKEWIAASPIFKILCLAILPASIHMLCRNIMKVEGNTRMVLYIETIKSVLLICFLFLGIIFGSMGVIWGLVIAQTISALVWLYFTEREFLIKKAE